MAERIEADLNHFYQQIQITGRLRTSEHAKQWTRGVLQTLGTSLNRGTKRALGKTLPKELREHLYSVFLLLHFRDSTLTSHDFRLRAARRSGNSDVEFALYPTLGVFAGIRSLIDSDLDQRISESLSPEVRQMWETSSKSN